MESEDLISEGTLFDASIPWWFWPIFGIGIICSLGLLLLLLYLIAPPVWTWIKTH